jgi:hypothetical protein
MEELSPQMAEGKAADWQRLKNELSTKKGGTAKRKKEAKKEKRDLNMEN